MKKLTFYKAVESGRSRETGYFGTEEAARAYVNRYPRWCFYEISFDVFDSVEDYEQNSKEAVRARAMAKLTPEERAALGVYE